MSYCFTYRSRSSNYLYNLITAVNIHWTDFREVNLKKNISSFHRTAGDGFVPMQVSVQETSRAEVAWKQNPFLWSIRSDLMTYWKPSCPFRMTRRKALQKHIATCIWLFSSSKHILSKARECLGCQDHENKKQASFTTGGDINSNTGSEFSLTLLLSP